MEEIVSFSLLFVRFLLDKICKMSMAVGQNIYECSWKNMI